MEEKKLRTIAEEYIEFLDRKEITKQSYKKVLMKYADYMESLTISNPTRNDVLKYKEYLLSNLASATVQLHIVVLRGFYKYCKLNGYSEDCTYDVRGCKVQQTFKRQSLRVEDSKKLLSKVRYQARTSIIGKRNYAIVALLLTTGLRSIEIQRADVYDLDYINGDHVLFIQGKGRDDKDEYVKLSDAVYEIIQTYLIHRNNDDDALFLTHNNKNKPKRLSTKIIRSEVKELLRSIGYDSKAYSVHSLRHTFATTLLDEGVSIYETKEALRHSNISTTQIYIHTLEQMGSNANQKMSDLLLSNKSKNKK